MTVPAGLQAISNGRLVGRRTHGQRTTWVWDAPEPMAPYLAKRGPGRVEHIWLNGGFATYAEWLWSEDHDLGTAQEAFDFFYNDLPAGDSFWDVVVGDPGIPFLFDGAVYVRGAMTLQALRNQVGDRDFFRILRAWAQRKAGGDGTTGQFIALAERVSGEQLDQLFETWLFTATKPALPAATATGKLRAPPAASSLLQRLPTAALGLRRS